jgi:hypothetical protein
MRKSLAFLAILLLQTPDFASAQEMRTFQIMDNQGFGQPMVAFTIDIPSDWSARGEVVWIKPCSSSDNFELVLDISSPDGLTGLRIQPGHKLFWNDVVVTGFDPELAQMMTAQALSDRNALASQLRGSNCHVSLVESEDQLFNGAVNRPDDMRIVSRAPNSTVQQQYQAIFQPVGQGMRFFFDAEQIELAYSLSGQEVRETLFFSWYLIQLDPLDPSFGTFAQFTTIEPLRSGRVALAREQQDRALLQQIVSSFKTDPAWQSRMDQYYREAEQRAQAAAQQRREDNEAAWQQHQADVAARTLRNDQQHAQFMQLIWQ